ncbi:MAG: polysaccharide biosynthesis/export family protein [Xanthobacteraceae bacterium]
MGQDIRRLFDSVGLIGISALLTLSMSGSGSLPDSGPSASDIAAQQGGSDQQQRYLVVDIDPSTIEVLKRKAFGGFSSRFGDHNISAEPVIGVGDAISVTIWEASAGGLFSAPLISDKIGTGSNSAMIPEQTVGRDGGITVPYAGRIRVAGKTTRAVQQTIEKALEGKAIQPQVLVNVTRPVSNSVSVGGEVSAGARIPLSVKGDRLLDVISTAGGVRAPVNETFIELSRGSTTSRIPLITVINNPRENIYLHPGDTLTLVRDPQKFIAYGATGANAEIPFDADGVTLAEALAKSGGLQDNRSDPRGVFIFRYEPEVVARQYDPSSPIVQSGRLTPVVYRLDLTDPNSLFLEQRFRIANRDLIYVSNSPSTEVQKVFAIIGGGVATLGAGASIASAGAAFK